MDRDKDRDRDRDRDISKSTERCRDRGGSEGSRKNKKKEMLMRRNEFVHDKMKDSKMRKCKNSGDQIEKVQIKLEEMSGARKE